MYNKPIQFSSPPNKMLKYYKLILIVTINRFWYVFLNTTRAVLSPNFVKKDNKFIIVLR